MESKKRVLFNEDGATLIILIVSLIAIGLLGAAVNTMTNRSTMDSANLNYTQRAYYLAESGIRWMEAEYKNDSAQAEDVYINITDTAVTPGGVISMGEAHGGGQLAMEIHPFSGNYDPIRTQTNQMILNYPGTLDPYVVDNLNATPEITKILWHNGDPLKYKKVELIENGDKTHSLKVTVLDPYDMPAANDRVAFTAEVAGDEVIKNDGDLVLKSGEEFLPKANGVIRTKAIISGVVDYIKFQYKRRDGKTLQGITHFEDRDGSPVTQATLIADEPLVVLPSFHYVATGTVGTATATVNGFLYDGLAPNDTEVIEHVEDGESLDNWISSNPGNKGSFKIVDGAIKVSSLDSYAAGSKAVYEASMTLDWEKAGICLKDAVTYAGGFLSYEVQTKLKQGQAEGTDDNSYFAGISFRARKDGTQYGVSLFRPRDIVSVKTDTLELTGIVRDFKADPTQDYDLNNVDGWHPDFQRTNSGLKTDYVKDALGEDLKPVYNTNGPYDNTSYLAGEEYFNQWYNDVPGVNMSKEYTLTFEKEEATGKYIYDNSAFFPIDGELFGNYWYWKDQNKGTKCYPYRNDKNQVKCGKASDSKVHNYHFTFELRSQFTYVEGQTFTFRGDDDVWVFIGNEIGGNKLVIDLSGCHGPKTGTIALKDIILPKNGEKLIEGETYDFYFFCAERHTYGSNFKITTDIELINLTDGIPGGIDRSGGITTVWPHLPPDNGTTQQVKNKTIWGDGWNDDTVDWLNNQCDGGSDDDGPDFFIEYNPNPDEMIDSDCTDDCFPICSDTKPTYYDVWNTVFDWGSENSSDEIESTGANNTFLVIWERTINNEGTYDYNWLAYRLLDKATDLPEASESNGIIEGPDTGKIRDWSTLGVRVKEVAYLWINVTDTTAYNKITRGEDILVGSTTKEKAVAGGECFDPPMQLFDTNHGMLLLTRVNRDVDDKIHSFAKGSNVFVKWQETTIGTIVDVQEQVNVIQAYVSVDKEGTPSSPTTELIALDLNRLGNPRDKVNWLPEDKEGNIDESNDFHRVVQWMGWNSKDYYSDYSDYEATEVSAKDTYWTRNTYNIDRVFLRLGKLLTTDTDDLPFSIENNPEVGIHAFGFIEEEVDENGDPVIVNSGIDMYFDDFAIRAEIPIPELGADIGTSQSR